MRTFSLSSFHHSLVLFLMFYEIFITIFIVLSLFLVVFFLDLHSTLDKINCLYLIFVFSRTKFVDSLSRIENKSCVSIQRVLNRALLKSNNFFSTEQNATERSWSRGLSSSAVLLNNNKTHLKITFFFVLLQRKCVSCFMRDSTWSSRFPWNTKETTQWCGYFIGIINILSIVFSIFAFSYILLNIFNFFC
jgi:hypothetical protein